MVVLTTLFHHKFKTPPVSHNSFDYFFHFIYGRCRSTFLVNEVVNRLTMKMMSDIFIKFFCVVVYLLPIGMFQNIQ